MTDLKVVPISDDSQNGENVVERLEQALEIAKSGGIKNCIVIMAKNDCTLESWANGSMTYKMIGAIESLKRDFMEAYFEKR